MTNKKSNIRNEIIQAQHQQDENNEKPQEESSYVDMNKIIIIDNLQESF